MVPDFSSDEWRGWTGNQARPNRCTVPHRHLRWALSKESFTILIKCLLSHWPIFSKDCVSKICVNTSIAQFCYFKNQIDAIFIRVCPLIDHETRHNIVKLMRTTRGAHLRRSHGAFHLEPGNEDASALKFHPGHRRLLASVRCVSRERRGEVSRSCRLRLGADLSTRKVGTSYCSKIATLPLNVEEELFKISTKTSKVCARSCNWVGLIPLT